jgi:chaperonin GroEL
MTIKTSIAQKEQAQEKLLKGARIVAEAVGSTLGPSGKNVAIAYTNERGIYARIIMKDGVTVARSIELEDEDENFGAQVIKEAARKTVDAVGDGTTVSTILSYSIFEEIHRLVAAGHDPMLLRKGIETATKDMVKEIEKIAIPVKTLEQKQQIANISAQDEELGKMIAETIDKMGEDGLVLPEESTNAITKVEIQQGLQFDKGWAAPEFMTNPDRGEATIENAHLLITDGFIHSLEPIKDLLQQCADQHKKLVIISANFSLIATGLMIDNKNQGIISSLLIEAPGVGNNQKNILQDIAIFTHGKFFSQSTGLDIKDAKLEDLGRCEYIKSTHNTTLIAGGIASKEQMKARIAEIKKSLDTEELEYDKEKIKERLARLTNGVAVIKVGGATEIEMKERLERVKDSVAATKAAVKKGIVPGGEVVYLTIREKLDQKDIAQNILYKALYQPFKILLNNASMNDGEWYNKLQNTRGITNPGVNVIKQEMADMVKEGIIDPALVPCEALKNATSTAIANASAGFIIIQKDIDKK